MSNALRGWRIWVSRAAHQARGLCALIEDAGGEPLCLPALEIRPVSLDWSLVGDSDWLIFVSRNAVEQAFEQCPRLDRRAARIAAIGRATRAALSQRNITVAEMPADGFDSESLLRLAAFRDIAGQRVSIVKGRGGRALLADTLRRRGARVASIEVYQRALPAYSAETLRRAFSDRLDAMTATSGEVLDNMSRLLGERRALYDAPLIVVSQRVADRAARLGFTRVEVSREPGDAALLQALIEQRGRNSTGKA